MKGQWRYFIRLLTTKEGNISVKISGCLQRTVRNSKLRLAGIGEEEKV